MSAASDTNTLTDFLATQDALQREAALALPHSFSACTYSRGAIRQPIYLCRTCAVPRGVCAACSIACHPSHEQLELFPKRNFICDCPTTSIPHPCTLHQREEGENIGNSYAKNFRGEFCRCGRDYDAMEEVETMIQCLACEDWFHESCLNLRERPPLEPEPESSPLESAVQPSEPSALPIDSIAQLSESLTSSRSADSIVQPSEPAVQDGDDVDDDDALSTTSTILPPPLLSASDYDAFVCSACVRDIPLLQHYAGTHGARIVLRSSPREPWRMHEGGRATEAEKIDIDGESTEKHNEVGQKRALSPDDSSSAKRPRLGHDEPRAVSESTPPSSTCLKPPADPVAQRIYAHLPDDTSLGAGDVFLTEGWRQRWCRCSDCLPQLQTRPYLLEEEETYEPPEDPDSQFSLEELGMRALSRLPRDRAIDGIHAFNTMRDGLMQFLRPFAQEGKVVGEEDIRRFFDGKPGSGGRNI